MASDVVNRCEILMHDKDPENLGVFTSCKTVFLLFHQTRQQRISLLRGGIKFSQGLQGYKDGELRD